MLKLGKIKNGNYKAFCVTKNQKARIEIEKLFALRANAITENIFKHLHIK